MPMAVVIDGAFFLRRFGSTFPNLNANSVEDIALGVTALSSWHLAFRLNPQAMLAAIEQTRFQPEESRELYRIFFYDCAPLTKKIHQPVSKVSLDLSKSDTATFRLAVHRRLRAVRKVALRLGRLNDSFGWRPKPEAWKRWLESPSQFAPHDHDFELDVVQKGVDMRLGLDIASMAFKKQVDQIVMVAADADFVPAAKLARREGIDVVLDRLGHHAANDLLEHVDGVRSCLIRGLPAHLQQEPASS